MLITSKFVVLNLPKTGSSFVRDVIKTIYRQRRWRWGADRFLKELMMPRRGGILPGRDQHGSYSQIPERYRELPVVSVVRNPYDRLLSAYEYRWWAKYPPLPKEELRRRFPNFPDLSLDQFIELWEVGALRILRGANDGGLGRQTIQFVEFFFRDYEAVLSSLSDAYVESCAFKENLPNLTLLKQERLNDDLAAFLEGHGFSPSEVELCRKHPRVNETLGRTTDRQSLWTPSALEYVRTRERHLFSMLRQLGAAYDAQEPPVHGPITGGSLRT